MKRIKFFQLASPEAYSLITEKVRRERFFNNREGQGRKHDILPKRMLTEPQHTDDAEGEGQIVRHQDEFLDRYYELRGWSKEGVPSEEKLASLNIGGL